MELAKLSSKRPINNDKSPTKIVGACIVSPNKQVISVASSGYPDKMPQLNADEDDQSAYSQLYMHSVYYYISCLTI